MTITEISSAHQVANRDIEPVNAGDLDSLALFRPDATLLHPGGPTSSPKIIRRLAAVAADRGRGLIDRSQLRDAPRIAGHRMSDLRIARGEV